MLANQDDDDNYADDDPVNVLVQEFQEAHAGPTVPPSSHTFPDQVLPVRPAMKSVTGPNAPHLPLLPRWNTLLVNAMNVALFGSEL